MQCVTTMEKKKDKAFFILPRDPALVKVWIAKVNREKENPPKNV